MSPPVAVGTRIIISDYDTETSVSLVGIIEDVKRALSATLALAVMFCAACSSSNIDNKEAVQAAMIEYLETNKAATGLDPAAMDVKVDAVQFERDTARATVSFLIKGSTQGMQGNYTLTRTGDKWGGVKRQNLTAAPHGVEPVGGAAPPATGAAPDQGKAPLIPVPLPGTQQALPAGHPPVPAGTK